MDQNYMELIALIEENKPKTVVFRKHIGVDNEDKLCKKYNPKMFRVHHSYVKRSMTITVIFE